MSNVFTLDSLREETIRQFEPTKIELSDGSKVELKSILKIGEKAREAAMAVVDELQEIPEPEDDEDEEAVEEYAEAICEAVAKIFRLVTPKYKRLLAELDHEDPQIKATLHTSVLNRWIKGSQLGEAESSPA
ncbi:tail assembly chaperone [Mycobacterium phage Acolyte]|nr:tail assembly chaperone [Mycobacterium phage Acolyte]